VGKSSVQVPEVSSATLLQEVLKDDKKFSMVLLKAVDRALVESLGTTSAAVVKFYVDTTTIVKKPSAFLELLRRYFKGAENGPEILEKKIRWTLADCLQIQIDDTMPTIPLTAFIDRCKNIIESRRASGWQPAPITR
jgi:hypothetical protein